MNEWRQSRLRALLILSGAGLVVVGFAAAASAFRPSVEALVTTAIFLPLTGILIIAGAWRWPRLLVAAAFLLDLDGILMGALFVAGVAAAQLFPLASVGLLQFVANRRTIRVGYVAAAVSAAAGFILGFFFGPLRGLPGVAPVPVTIAAAVVIIGLAFGVNWAASNRLAQARSAVERESTARQSTDEELRRTTQLLESILDSSPISTMAFRPDRTVIIWNRAAERTFGWTAKETVGQSLPVEMTPTDDRESSADRIRRTFAGEVIEGDLVRRLTKDGRELSVEIYAASLPGPDGRPIGIAGQFVDVTERIALNAELRRTQETLQAIVAAAPLAMATVDRDNIIRVWNPAAERIFGWSSEEAVGRHVTEVTGVEPAELDEIVRRLAAGEIVTGLPIVRRGRDGRSLDLRIFQAALRDHDGGMIGAVAIIEDISERRALEAQLRQAQKMETVGQLAGSIAHDFNNVLMAIRGFAELIESSLGPDHGSTPDVEEIIRSTDRAADLTTRLLAFSRRTPVGTAVVKLNAVVDEMAPMLRRLAGPRVELHTALDPRTGHVRINVGQIEQAILNLVINARDAMPDGGIITIATDLGVSEDAGADGAEPGEVSVITVSDTGGGMTADVAERVFEPFFTTKQPGQGTGLGLAIVYGVVQNAAGDLSVTSTPGSGSTFRIALPAVAAERPVIADTPLAADRGTETILLVEDEDAIRALTVRALTRQGYRVIPAPGADAARDLWAMRDAVIDLLLTDVTMPGTSGPALAAELTAADPTLRVLFISGLVPDEPQGPSLPPDAPFLRKPFSIADLQRAVRAALDREPTGQAQAAGER